MTVTRTQRSQETASSFWPVYSDLALSLVLILVLFLLAQFVFNSRLLVTQDVSRVRTRMLQGSLHRQLEKTKGVVSIVENGNLQIITLSADFLFPSDDAHLTGEGAELLQQLGKQFFDNQERFTRVAVEGHADAQGSLRFRAAGDNAVDLGNWRLSAERAIRVVQLLQGIGLSGSKLEVVGRSNYEPIDTTYRRYPLRTKAGQIPVFDSSLRNNRRIVIRLFYSERSTHLPR